MLITTKITNPIKHIQCVPIILPALASCTKVTHQCDSEALDMATKALLRLQTVLIILHGQKIITNHELLIRYIFCIRTQLITNQFSG